LLPFLKTGVLFALTQSKRRTPSDNDLLIRAARDLASSAAPSFKRGGQIPSGPHALLILRADSSKNISDGYTEK